MLGRCILDQTLRQNKLSRVGGWVDGWLEQIRIRLSQLPTKLKLKLKLSLAKGKIAKNETEIENKATLTHLSALCACFFSLDPTPFPGSGELCSNYSYQNIYFVEYAYFSNFRLRKRELFWPNR